MVDDTIIAGATIRSAAELLEQAGFEVKTCSLASRGQAPPPDFVGELGLIRRIYPWD